MNAVAKVAPTDQQVIEVLGNSLYPGAKPESVALVLSYCRANGYDPMKRPVHIVPMSVKLPSGKYEYRDVIMPGIGQYRIDAARTGEYAGKTEPEFGPDAVMKLGSGEDEYGNKVQARELVYPTWCKVTIYRLVNGKERAFTAKEFWLENYATGGKGSTLPNTMWRKRPYGQLAKCAESQALRMAFPEQTGGTNTAEEMEGKTLVDAGPYIDHEPERAEPAKRRVEPPAVPDLEESAYKKPPSTSAKGRTWADALADLEAELDRCASSREVDDVIASERVQKMLDSAKNGTKDRLNAIIKIALDKHDSWPGPDVGAPADEAGADAVAG